MHLVGRWTTPRDASLVWHIHDYVAARPVTSRLLSHTVGRCAAVVANSQSVADDLRVVFGDRVEIATLYNAVDLDRFSPHGPIVDLDRLAGLQPPPAGVVRVGLVAALAWWKGHQLFLEAIKKIARETPASDVSIRAYIIGGPLYETEGSQCTLDDLRRLAAEMELADRVGFTGFLHDPARAMRSLDVVVHASTEPEPFGLVIAEAMASGRPVVASRSGGAAELIADGVDGLFFEPGSAEELAACIVELATDSTRRAELGRAARATAIRRFDSRRLAAELVPFYQRLRQKH
jgi:glycosyltransferase involved in cell wall biosynthesis